MHASHRATLDVEVSFSKPDGSELVERRFALNDLVLTRGVKGDMIAFDVAVSGHHIDRLRGDGFVVSTATGSTGSHLPHSGGRMLEPGQLVMLLNAKDKRYFEYLLRPAVQDHGQGRQTNTQ